MKLTLDGRTYDVQVEDGTVVVDGQSFQVALKGSGLTRTATVNGRSMRVDLGEDAEGGRTANVDGKVWSVEVQRSAAAVRAAPSARADAPAARTSDAGRRTPTKGAVTAQMAGRVLRIAVTEGEAVEAGALLLILEAMKMENEIRAPRAGTVTSIAVSAGDRVNNGDPLVVIGE